MRITIIPSDKTIGIGETFISGIQQDLSWIPKNVHAVQWYETHGEIEYTDGKKNKKIKKLGIYSQAIDDFNSELKKIEDERIAYEKAIEDSRDYQKELKIFRNELLTKCDWTQLPDAPLSDEKKQEWNEYRQKLRDLPSNTEDPKNPEWPTPPS